jgi:hypothetical protein
MSSFMKVQNKGLSKSWRVSKQHVAAYTGGKVQVSSSGDRMMCMFAEDVAFLNTETGEVLRTLQQNTQVKLVYTLFDFTVLARRK